VQWITDGAAPGSAAQAAGAFAIAAVAPEDGTTVNAAPAYIALNFTRELDATQADAAAVRLERLGDQNGASIVTARISVPAGNTRTLLLTPLQPLPDADYRIVLSGDGISQLRALDGTTLAPPPIEGGERVVSHFSVQGH
jgi:methionine-rich copper-binding protein CopC